jgi:hypothetical protein
MIIEELVHNIKQNDMEAFKELYKDYRDQVYYTVYSIVKDKDFAKELLQNIFTKAYVRIKSMKQAVDLEDLLYSVTAEVLRKVRGDNKKFGSEELMGFVYDFPFRLRNQKLTDDDYDKIFEHVINDIAVYNNRRAKVTMKIGPYTIDYRKAAFVLLIVFMIPIVYSYWSKRIDDAIVQEPSAEDKFVRRSENLSVIEDFVNSDRISIWDGMQVYSEPKGDSEVLGVVSKYSKLEVKQAMGSLGEPYWLQVTVINDEYEEVTGWLHASGTKKSLASTARSGHSLDDAAVATLIQEYLDSLKGEEISGKLRIDDYKIHTAEIMYLLNFNAGTGRLDIDINCEIKPYDEKGFELAPSFNVSDEGYIQNLHFRGEVELTNNSYVLTSFKLGSERNKNSEFTKLLKENNLILLHSGGFDAEAASGRAYMPTKSPLSFNREDYLKLYIDYCNEISKLHGYDLKEYYGEVADIDVFRTVRKDDLRKQYELIRIDMNNEMRGIWLEKRNEFNGEYQPLSLDGRDFSSIIRDKDQWKNKKGFSDKADDVDRLIQLISLYCRRSIVYQLFDQNAMIAFSTAVDMAASMAKDGIFISSEVVVEARPGMDLQEVAEVGLKQYLTQFKNNELSDYLYIPDYEVQYVGSYSEHIKSRKGLLAYSYTGHYGRSNKETFEESFKENAFIARVDLNLPSINHCVFISAFPTGRPQWHTDNLIVTVTKVYNNYVVKVSLQYMG